MNLMTENITVVFNDTYLLSFSPRYYIVGCIATSKTRHLCFMGILKWLAAKKNVDVTLSHIR